MRSSERLIVVATIGLAMTAAGALLPWARIGGRSRSGLATADTFIDLGETALPDPIAWVGRWWYAPAFLVLAAWASVFTTRSRSVRLLGTGLTVVGLAMWWLFVWAADHYQVLDVRLLGPSVATVGLVTIAGCCQRP